MFKLLYQQKDSVQFLISEVMKFILLSGNINSLLM